MTRFGTLYGIGVGPGDPDLITLKAVKVLQGVDVVFAAASTKNEASLALSIARPHLHEGAEIVRLDFPMTRDQAVLDAAWKKNADVVAGLLGQGKSAAFLTLGDPLTYSTFGYLLRTLNGLLAEIPVKVVPGITSYQAAAAHTGRVLVESGENLAVVSGVAPEAELEAVLGAAQSAVILKAYKNMPTIRRVLDRLGLTTSSVFVTRLGHEGEQVIQSLDQVPEKPSYFSLILVRRDA
ncbi:MAG TPA: precorrin-2 C(20)-methyltransferase [Humidesulfovibrio sp.]|uniref:precorrin-2 C(20)-methyltransferase n=1 Tax=Humidesulfovibrio sp. TaxID=2910988 RepID=UPI002C0B4EAC|nr:precorrin-2 C(20)-methyltransferase [Humidesulfovibrio sp.]HWR03710.1 precorrin-2 C(20)-methyltransferase [Humidesulfovibrio sp.]